MSAYKIRIRDVADTCGCSMSAVDNYRVGACYPRMHRLLLLVELIAQRRGDEFNVVFLEVLSTAKKDHKKNQTSQ